MTLGILLIAILSRFSLRHLIFALVSLLGEILSRIFLFLALYIARIISAFLFALFIGPVWVIERLSQAKSYRIHHIDNGGNELEAEKMERGNRAGKNGIPSDWVTIKLCNTDEISELQLDEDTTRTQDGIQSGEVGSWEERELFTMTREEIDEKVWEWLEMLDA